MAKDILKIEDREKKSKSFLKTLRKNGKIPGIYYTHGQDATPIAFDARQFKQMLAHRVNLFDLDFGKGKNKQSIIREMQFDPITGKIIHVDLLGIKATEKVLIKVPVHLVGNPKGVKEEGGILEHTAREIEIECLPKDMPTSIDVDVSNLRLNESLHARDIHLENMSLVSDKDLVIAHVLSPRVEKAAEVEEIVAVEGETEGEEKESAEEE